MNLASIYYWIKIQFQPLEITTYESNALGKDPFNSQIQKATVLELKQGWVKFQLESGKVLISKAYIFAQIFPNKLS